MNIFRKLINRISEPLDMEDLDRMCLNEIAEGCYRIRVDRDDNTVLSPTPENIASAIAMRLRELVALQVDVSDLSITTLNCGYVRVDMPKFNKSATDYLAGSKFYIEGIKWESQGYGVYNNLPNMCTYSLNFLPIEYSDRLIVMARSIADDILKATTRLHRLKALETRLEYIIPVVGKVKIYCDDDNEWHVDEYEITPEQLDGFMEVMQKYLTPEEVAGWRKQCIAEFVRNSSGTADFNYPYITVSTPDAWRELFHSKILPDAERRDRCHETLEEINAQINNLYAHADIVAAQSEIYRRQLASHCLPLQVNIG